ncbi:hypothetical protein ACVME5_006176 [Bradyrhizobium liaoningense]
MRQDRNLRQHRFVRSRPQSSGYLQNRSFLLRHPIETRCNNALDTGGNAEFVDWTHERKIAPLAAKRAAVLQSAANLFDEQRNVCGMRYDPALQVGVRRGGAKHVCQHGQPRIVVEGPHRDDLSVAARDPDRHPIGARGEQHKQTGRL